MNKKNVVFLAVLLFVMAVFTSCLFESDDSLLSGWISSQGLKESYKVETVSIDGLIPISSDVFINTAPRSANKLAMLGRISNIQHDLVLDFGFDSTLLSTLKSSDSAASFLFFRLVKDFYKSEYFPKDSFPLKEDMSLNVSWKLERSSKFDYLKEVMNIKDESWYNSLKNWNPDSSVDSTYSISISKKDSTFSLLLPNALIENIRKDVSMCRLQLRLSAPDAKHMYRFYGPSFTYGPQFRMTTLSDTTFTYRNITPFRVVELISNKEECTDCKILHGGILDSLIVEFPSKPILEKLSEFYGDEFPYSVGDGYDVRQAVVLAQMTFSRDDSQGYTELNRPIQVVVGSFVDSSSTLVRKMEPYKLNKEFIMEHGHPNMVFHEGDSLTLQVTLGLRDFINKASDGRTFKMMMRLGYPVIQEKDTVYSNYITAKGDTSYVFFSQFDYARYDFTESMKKPATLKLWLASKRGENK